MFSIIYIQVHLVPYVLDDSLCDEVDVEASLECGIEGALPLLTFCDFFQEGGVVVDLVILRQLTHVPRDQLTITLLYQQLHKHNRTVFVSYQANRTVTAESMQAAFAD